MISRNIQKDTREHIIAVAFELFLTKGYREVTMSGLEKATKLTKGAFYHHFKDKLEIFEAVVSEKADRMRFRPDAGLLKTVSLHEFIGLYVEHAGKVARYLLDDLHISHVDLQFSKIVSDVISYMPGLKEKIIRITSEELTVWEGVICRAQEKGEIRSDMETTALAYTFCGIIHSMKRSFTLGKSTQYSLNIIQLQFEQLYSLVKKPKNDQT
jgi:AcrR family transcriptional regulator